MGCIAVVSLISQWINNGMQEQITIGRTEQEKEDFESIFLLRYVYLYQQDVY